MEAIKSLPSYEQLEEIFEAAMFHLPSQEILMIKPVIIAIGTSAIHLFIFSFLQI